MESTEPPARTTRPSPAAGDALARLSIEPPAQGRASAARLVAGTLRALITGAQLPPGTRLSEKALVEKLDVSRNTLREAFRILDQERLVVHRMNHGVFVRVLSAEDVADIYTVRRALETAGVRTAPPPPALAEAAAAVEAGEAAAARDDWIAVTDADLSFHRALGALTGSERIDSFLGGLLGELRLAFAVMPDRRPFHETFLVRNRALLDLLTAGRAADAEAELTAYLDDAEAMITDFMRKGRP